MARAHRPSDSRRSQAIAVAIGALVGLVAVLISFHASRSPVVVTEVEWSVGGYVVYVDRAALTVPGGSTFTENGGGQITNCTGLPAVSAPFAVSHYVCVRPPYYGPGPLGWTLWIQAPDSAFSGPILVTIS